MDTSSKINKFVLLKGFQAIAHIPKSIYTSHNPIGIIHNKIIESWTQVN